VVENRGSDHGFVVVTGTSTGIGAATVSRLANLGFHVFAGVRREADAEAARSAANGTVTPLMIDVTDPAMIDAAAKTVEEVVGQRGLTGLVNNAGIVKPGPLEFQPLEDFRRQLEVNLIGPLSVIQAFLPLIRRGRGRIVNVGSIGGLLVVPIQGAYSASKFGLEALSDALRLELRQWKIPVSHVDPGVTDTPIFGKTLGELDLALDALHERGHAEYDAQFAAVRKVVEKSPKSAAPPDDLAKAIADALTAAKPKTRYHAGHGSKEAFVAARTLTDHVKDRLVVHEVGLPRPE
jgi:NAD(P)-dependent dehydrogenase (short-subunit alcohol dehydrogenase family)